MHKYVNISWQKPNTCTSVHHLYRESFYPTCTWGITITSARPTLSNVTIFLIAITVTYMHGHAGLATLKQVSNVLCIHVETKIK